MANAPVERKVAASTGAATLLALVITILNAVVADSALLGGLPPAVQSLITLFAPPLVVFLAGYQARHTPRLPGA